MTTTPFTTFAFPTTDSPGTGYRTMPKRLADIYDVKDYGAVGDDVADDTTAIRAAIAAMWAADNHRGNHSGVVYFPPGKYKVTDSIDIGSTLGSGVNSSIIGPARGGSVYIHGDLPNGFVFYNLDGINSIGELADLTLSNDSNVIGSGAMFINNTSLVCNRVNFGGMISVLQGNNLYDVQYNNCTGGSGFNAGTTGYNGTLGIAGGCCSINGWRTTRTFMTTFSFEGSDNASVLGCGVENCAVVILAGAQHGWASTCTVAPDGAHPGSSILTIGGLIGNADLQQFNIGAIVYAKGLALPTWGNDPFDSTGGVTITANQTTDGTLTGDGFHAGTYRISGTYTISTAIPIIARSRALVKTLHVRGLQTEACLNQIYLQSVGACSIESIFGTATATDCANGIDTTNGLGPRAGIYIYQAQGTVIQGCVPSSGYLGSIVFDPNASLSNVTLNAVLGYQPDNNVGTGTITNGSGGAGFIMNITAFSAGSAIGVGMRVYDGSSLLTRVTQNHTLDATLTGTGQTGTYRVADSLNISSRTLTIKGGPDWVLPTNTQSKTGLKIINCGTVFMPAGETTGLNSLNMAFTSLPGEAGASPYISRIEGQEFFIIDGAKSGGGTAAMGDATQGGGTQHIQVGWNGTAWIRSW